MRINFAWAFLATLLFAACAKVSAQPAPMPCWPGAGATGVSAGAVAAGGWASWWCPGVPNAIRVVVKAGFELTPGSTYQELWAANASFTCAAPPDADAANLCTLAFEAAQDTKPAPAPVSAWVVAPALSGAYPAGTRPVFKLSSPTSVTLTGERVRSGSPCDCTTPSIISGVTYCPIGAAKLAVCVRQ